MYKRQPQVVVNGIVHVLGSDKAAIEKAIAQTRRTAAPLTLPVTMTVTDGKVTVNVPAATDEHHSGEVWLCPITSKVPVSIGRGENNGRTLTYTNVVRRWVKLGDWNGNAATFSVPVADLPDADYSLTDVDQLVGGRTRRTALAGEQFDHGARRAGGSCRQRDR